MKENCPCCRKEVNQYEKVNVNKNKNTPTNFDYLFTAIEDVEIHGYDTNEETNQLHDYERYGFTPPVVQLQLPPRIQRMAIESSLPSQPSLS